MDFLQGGVFCFSSKGNLGLNLHSLETLCKLMKCEKWKENSSYKVDGMAKIAHKM